MSEGNSLLYVDLETGFVGDVDMPGRERFTERHYVELTPKRGDAKHTPKSIYPAVQKPVVMALHNGLPTQDELAFSEMALRDRRDLYFHWPAENAVEVVTQERLTSFRNHRRLANAYWAWRNFRRGFSVNLADLKLRVRSNLARAKRMISAPASNRHLETSAAHFAPVSGGNSVAAAQNPSPSKFDFIEKRADGLYVKGRGLYFRLDYWAKLSSGGSYGHTVYQAKALSRASSEPLICVVPSRYELLDAIGIDQIVIPSPNHNCDDYSIVTNGEAYQGVATALLQLYRPAFVFERLVLGSRAVARACGALGIPYVVEFNGSEITMAKVFAGQEKENAATLQAIERESLMAADIVSVISEAVKSDVISLGVPAEKVLVNPNCVDLEAYGPLQAPDREALRRSLGFAAEDVVVGFCGTFGGWHGIEVLSAAMPRILSASPRAKFLLVGDGQHKGLVQEAIEKHGVGGRVVDLGRLAQADAARALAACDIFVSPHSSNMGNKPFFGSPTKLFEYMAYGVGIVCSDLEQLGEVMRPAIEPGADPATRPEGARGILVRPGSVDDLVRASLQLIEDGVLRQELGLNARTAASRYYTWDSHVQSLWRFAKGLPPIGYHLDRKAK